MRENEISTIANNEIAGREKRAQESLPVSASSVSVTPARARARACACI